MEEKIQTALNGQAITELKKQTDMLFQMRCEDRELLNSIHMTVGEIKTTLSSEVEFRKGMDKDFREHIDLSPERLDVVKQEVKDNCRKDILFLVGVPSITLGVLATIITMYVKLKGA